MSSLYIVCGWSSSQELPRPEWLCARGMDSHRGSHCQTLDTQPSHTNCQSQYPRKETFWLVNLATPPPPHTHTHTHTHVRHAHVVMRDLLSLICNVRCVSLYMYMGGVVFQDLANHFFVLGAGGLYSIPFHDGS